MPRRLDALAHLPLVTALVMVSACSSSVPESDAQDRVSFDLETSYALETCVQESGFTGTVIIADPLGRVGWFGPMALVDMPLLPASTFKIASTMMALDAGLVEGRDTVLPWDGVIRTREETNQALDLASAFQLSSVPHYQALVRDLGEAKVAAYLEALNYGNEDSSGGADRFWLTGGLRITPREQIQFLTRLVTGTLPFPSSVMAETREIMIVERTPEYRIHAKTGLTTPPEGETVGWWVGWVERQIAEGISGDAMAQPAIYLFATALTAPPPAPVGFIEARLEVTRCGLRALDILP
jgi:beta-lactamase class D